MKGSVCPTCRSIIDDNNIDNITHLIDDSNVKIKKIKSMLDNNIGIIKSINLELFKLNEKISELNKLIIEKNEIKNKLKKLKDDENYIKELKADYKKQKVNFGKILLNYKLKIKKLRQDISFLNEFDISELELYENKYEKLETLVTDTEYELKNNELDIKKYYSAVKSTTKIKEQISSFGSENEIMNFWKIILPKMKVDMISNVIPFLEMQANKYLSQLLPGKIMKFDADSSKVNNKLDVVIIDVENNLERIYEGWSGGEKDKMSISVYLALNKLSSLRSGKTFQFLILDEKFSSLDYESRSILIEVLKDEYKNRKLWVISHIENISDEFDQVIKVNKINGISSLEIIK